ncbi:MAG TPA: uroporphyrinogen-III C-methyltransferase [Chloroflexota bacterium]|nr:uroporphyrinogen-III C-methyltransferase [Chloroflexota bacterium]
MADRATSTSDMTGLVSLVGAGPGDPDLLTVKGLRRLQAAEVVVYDRLANDELLQQVPPDAELIFAGKGPGAHALGQDEINALLVAKGRAGKRVVRLKGGDPFVFGRGGEEAEALAAADIPFEVVPGVTSAIAAPAYAGIPVTHRDFTPAFTVVTGHEDPTKGESMVPWEALAAGPDTLVFLMGVGHLEAIGARLIAAGRAPATPVAVVRRGTWPDQQLVLCTLASIAEDAALAGLTAPAVTVVGRVAGLAPTLAWFPGSLSGKAILVTRARDQAGALSARLRSFGARVIEFPAIRIEPAADYSDLDAALAEPTRFDWICFTSVNAVKAIDERLRTLGNSWAALGAIRLAAIGPATARALRAEGAEVAYMPETFLADAVAAGLPDAEGARILLARADIADLRMVEGLERRGARVEQYIAYRTVPGDEDAPALRRALTAGEVDIVTFTSSSTVRNLCQALGDDVPVLLSGLMVACIGPVTAETARECGLAPAIVAREHTIGGLVAAIQGHLARSGASR